MARNIVTDNFRAWLTTRPQRAPKRTDESWKARGRELALISRGLCGASDAEKGDIMDAWAPERDTYETARRNSRAGRHKRDRSKGQWTRAVARVVEKLPDPAWGEFLKAIEHEEWFLDICAARSDPIDIVKLEVDQPQKLVRYQTHADLETKRSRSISFKTLKNLLSR